MTAERPNPAHDQHTDSVAHRPDRSVDHGDRDPGSPNGFRWQTVDAGTDALFGVDDLFADGRSTGRMSDLEFLHVTAKRILNHVPAGSRAPSNWTINVYRGCSHACLYCFARPTHEYLGMNLGDDFDRRIVVKINAVDKVRAELADPRWQHEAVAMGTNTDPYQRAEAKYRLTRGVLEALTDHATPFSILTKSPLVARDLDVLVRANATLPISVNFSVGTLDERVWRFSEPGAPHPRRRLDAMARLADAGIRTGALIAPVLPGLSDGEQQLREVVDTVRSAGGRILGVSALYLRPGVREHVLARLADADPALHRDYLRRYAASDYAPRRYQDELRRRAGLR